jgi:hypothetical protein
LAEFITYDENSVPVREHHSEKAYGVVEAKLQIFLISKLD